MTSYKAPNWAWERIFDAVDSVAQDPDCDPEWRECLGQAIGEIEEVT